LRNGEKQTTCLLSFKDGFSLRRSISKRIKCRAEVLEGDEPSWLFTKRKPRIDSIKEEVKQTICHFWTFEASRPTGDKKDIV